MEHYNICSLYTFRLFPCKFVTTLVYMCDEYCLPLGGGGVGGGACNLQYHMHIHTWCILIEDPFMQAPLQSAPCITL